MLYKLVVAVWYIPTMTEIIKPHLKHKATFELILADYKISPHAQTILDTTKLVIFTGVAASGRNTIINELVKTGKYHFIVSDTTRPPKLRDGHMEQDGVQYFFRTEADFLADLKAGEFLEAEVIHGQQVSGISIRELDRASKSGKIAINEVELGGARTIAAAKPDAYIIGVIPSSYDEWLRRFLGRETIADEEFMNRMRTAQKVLQQVLTHPAIKIVINDDLGQCVEDVRAIVERAAYSAAQHARGRKVTKDLLAHIDRTLAGAD